MQGVLDDLNWLQTAHHAALSLRVFVMLYALRMAGKFCAWLIEFLVG